MKSHTMIEKTLSEHIIMVILHFWVKNVVFEQKWFHLSKLPVFYGNNSNGLRKHSLKFGLDQIIFLDFTGIESLQYKEIRVSGAKLFLMSIYWDPNRAGYAPPVWKRAQVWWLKESRLTIRGNEDWNLVASEEVWTRPVI